MKTFFMIASAVTSVFFLHVAAVSCGRLGEEGHQETGKLCVSFYPPDPVSRSGMTLPDTCDFILSIKDSKGRSIYDGAYGDCPESVELPAGSYTVRAVSCEFEKPAFDCPQFGDEQCVVVKSGGVASVKLICSQMNAGVSLDLSSDFLTSCPNSVLFLKSSAGRLMYSYNEKRKAYFPPGNLAVVMNTGTSDEIIYTRDLEARDMVVVKVAVAKREDSISEGISISIDTTRIWTEEHCVAGGEEKTLSDGMLTVAQAMNSVGSEDVWVSGYIVGGDLTKTSASFENPFKSMTNILLGPRSSTTDRNACVSVQLPAGAVRDALNLVENPALLKSRVRIRGDVVDSYFGLKGIKNTSDYELL